MPTTKTYQVYKFSELPPEAQEKALEKNRDINVDDSFWYDYDGKTGFTAEEIKKYRLDPEHSTDLLEYKDLYFDLDRAWYIQFKDARFAHDETARKFLGVPKRIWDNTHWEFVNKDYGGNSHGTTRLEWEYGNGFLTDRVEQILNRAVERFADKMQEALKDLQDTWEYLTSDEAIKETFEANDYDFTIDGRID